jgi:hypothetical protein
MGNDKVRRIGSFSAMRRRDERMALTLSQHLRSTRGRTRTSRTSPMAFVTEFLAVLLGATLVLSACGTQQAGAAAIVNGTAISDKDVQTVSLQLNTLAQGQAKLTSSTVLLSLIVAPYVLAEAKRSGQSVSDAEVLKVITKVAAPSRSTMDFVRMQLALGSLSQASKLAILTKLGTAKITVNPRYGTFDAKQIALRPISPDWIKASAPLVAK